MTTTIGDDLLFPCPNCGVLIAVAPNEVNCGIFRHAASRTGKVILPHASAEEIAAVGDIYGCGQPFRLRSDGTAEQCGYI